MGMLYVDRDNAEARGLYKALGFFDDHVDRAYTGDIAAAEAS
jgi:ribosomal protein S18 acetylase RimI-like enzyme